MVALANLESSEQFIFNKIRGHNLSTIVLKAQVETND